MGEENYNPNCKEPKVISLEEFKYRAKEMEKQKYLKLSKEFRELSDDLVD